MSLPRTRMMAKIAIPLITAGVLCFNIPLTASAQDESPPVDVQAALAASPDGYVTLSGGVVAAGVGFSWGHGTLDFQGAKQKFTLQGLSVVDVGAARISASGYVYHMLRLGDFAGNYTAFAAAATVAGGEGVAYLKNDKGVILKLTSTAQGLRFNISPEGIHVKLVP